MSLRKKQQMAVSESFLRWWTYW